MYQKNEYTKHTKGQDGWATKLHVLFLLYQYNEVYLNVMNDMQAPDTKGIAMQSTVPRYQLCVHIYKTCSLYAKSRFNLEAGTLHAIHDSATQVSAIE